MTDKELADRAWRLTSTYSHNDLARMLATSMNEVDRLRAKNRRLVEACKLGLRVIEELVATDTGVATAMRATIEKE